MEKFILEQPTLARQQDAIDYINEFYQYGSDINGVGGLHRYLDNYSAWLKKLDTDQKCQPTAERVPAMTYFLVRQTDNKIVGMTNIRLALNETLKNSSGTIGYSIRPTERRKGYAKLNLYLSLKQLADRDIHNAIVSCNPNNLGSSKTIQALGGEFDREVPYGDESLCLYNFDVRDCLDKYKSTYEPLVGIQQINPTQT